MTFSYVLCGWEGSAHDGKVLKDAITKNLLLPANKYYLGDAGYSLESYCLTPFRGVRYHLKEWKHAQNKPNTREELYNLRHSSLRNVVERTFGVLKKRWAILKYMPSFSFDIQIELVYACCYLHNWIIINNSNDDEYNILDENDIAYINRNRVVANIEGNHIERAPLDRLNQWRNDISNECWIQYQYYLNNNDDEDDDVVII
jgi:hypothetical protein